MQQFLSLFLPEEVVPFVTLALCVFLCYLYVRYNILILKIFYKVIESITYLVNKVFSLQANYFERKVLRTNTLKPTSFLYNFYKGYDEIITTLDLKKDGIQPMGLALFLIISSLVIDFVLSSLFNFTTILFFIAIPFCYYFEKVLFRILTISRFERREKQIMNAVDCLCGNITGGVLNAIRTSVNTDGIHPDIKPYFQQFCDDIEMRNVSFAEAMQTLNAELGPCFSDFAYKAALYEKKGDTELASTFTSVVIVNQQKRDIREQNAKIFGEVLIAFFISVLMIVGFVFACIYLEPNVVYFFTQHWLGKVCVIIDVAICSAVLYFIMSLKAKSL